MDKTSSSSSSARSARVTASTPGTTTKSSGPKWSLYPLLALIAVASFLLGLAHLFFCLPFFPLLLPLLNGTLAAIAAFYALFLRYPNRCDLMLQVLCTVLGFFFVLSSLVETICLARFASADPRPTEDVDGRHEMTVRETEHGLCHGLKWRTLGLTGSCQDLLSNLQASFFDKFSVSAPLLSVQFAISLSLSILALLQLVVCCVLSFYTAKETRLLIRSYHQIGIVGALCVLLGLAHYRYCCIFFYAFGPTLYGVFAVLQSLAASYYGVSSQTGRAMNLVGSALAVAVLALHSLGFFCWFNDLGLIVGWPLTRFCAVRPDSYSYCHRVLAFSRPYIDWTVDEVNREVLFVRLLVYLASTLLTSLHFVFSMKAAFGLEPL